MTEHNIKIPDGMLKAAINSRKQIHGQVAGWSEGMCSQVLESALRWMSENPTIPTREQWVELNCAMDRKGDHTFNFILAEWQRRMFLAPKLEPEISFEEKMNELTVEVNRLGMSAAIEILRRTS